LREALSALRSLDAEEQGANPGAAKRSILAKPRASDRLPRHTVGVFGG